MFYSNNLKCIKLLKINYRTINKTNLLLPIFSHTYFTVDMVLDK